MNNRGRTPDLCPFASLSQRCCAESFHDNHTRCGRQGRAGFLPGASGRTSGGPTVRTAHVERVDSYGRHLQRASRVDVPRIPLTTRSNGGDRAGQGSGRRRQPQMPQAPSDHGGIPPLAGVHPDVPRQRRVLRPHAVDRPEPLDLAEHSELLDEPALRAAFKPLQPGCAGRMSLLRKALFGRVFAPGDGARDGQRAGCSVRRMVVAVTAGDPESGGFMRSSCR